VDFSFLSDFEEQEKIEKLFKDTRELSSSDTHDMNLLVKLTLVLLQFKGSVFQEGGLNAETFSPTASKPFK